MSSEGMDTRFFGRGFQEKIPEADPVVRAVGALMDKYVQLYRVDKFEDVPPEGQEEFEAELQTISLPLNFGEEQSE